MIILSNKAYYGTDTVVYNLYKDTEDIPGGLVTCTFTSKGAIVSIELYGSCWNKGVHHYLDEICEVLKFAEPNVRPIKVEINKVGVGIDE